MRIVVADAVAPEGVAYLREHGCQVDEVAGAPSGTLERALADAEGLVTRSSTAVPSELLQPAPRLRIVGRAGGGVDNIEVDASGTGSSAGTRDVVNAPYGNVVSAAEHTVGMLLTLMRRIPEAHARLKTLEWNRSIYGSELYRKSIGIVGVGKVGSRVAERLRGFEATLHVPPS